MNIYRFPFFILSLLLVFTCRNSFSQTEQNQIIKHQQDFEILKTALFENEAGLYIYNDSLEVLNLFSQTQNALYSKKSDLEFFKIICSLISSIQCGHTQVFPSKKIINEYFNQASTLPFDVKLMDEKLYLEKDYDYNPKLAKHDEILRINNKEIPELLAEMQHLIASDGHNISFKYKQIEDYFLLYYYFTQNIPQKFELDILNKNGDTLKMHVNPAFPNWEDYRNKENISLKKEDEIKYGSLKIMKSANYAVFTFHDFNKAYGRKYKKFIDDSFEKINKSGIENLIIDLKDNFGGKNQHYLTTYLAKDEINYSAITTKGIGKPSYNRYIKKFNRDYLLCRIALYRNKLAVKKQLIPLTVKTQLMPRADAYKGNIFVLINENTFSAASNFASNLKEKCHATIIGKQSGGSYKQGNTGKMRLILPNSKLTVLINPINYHNLPLNTSQKEPGVMPHYSIKENYPAKKNSDPYMKQALKLIIEKSDHPDKQPFPQTE